MNPADGTCAESSLDSRELRIRLRDLTGGAGIAPATGMFARVYRSRRWGRDGAPEWAAFVADEGLRVEDLDSQPSRDVVRLFACGLVDAGMKQRDAAFVAGLSQATVCRYVSAAGQSIQVPAVEQVRELGPNVGRLSRENARVLAEQLLAEAAAAPPVPGSALALATVKAREVAAFVQEFASALAYGSTLGADGGTLLRPLVKTLEAQAARLRDLGQEQGLRI